MTPPTIAVTPRINQLALRIAPHPRSIAIITATWRSGGSSGWPGSTGGIPPIRRAHRAVPLIATSSPTITDAIKVSGRTRPMLQRRTLLAGMPCDAERGSIPPRVTHVYRPPAAKTFRDSLVSVRKASG
jgi:hypothetical protein